MISPYHEHVHRLTWHAKESFIYRLKTRLAVKFSSPSFVKYGTAARKKKSKGECINYYYLLLSSLFYALHLIVRYMKKIPKNS
jgi:hypothetical protein